MYSQFMMHGQKNIKLNSLCISLLPHACTMTCPSHAPSLDHSPET